MVPRDLPEREKPLETEKLAQGDLFQAYLSKFMLPPPLVKLLIFDEDVEGEVLSAGSNKKAR